MMRKFSELKPLTEEQERFVDENMYEWGAWIRSGRIDKSPLNIIAKLMQSAIPAEPGERMCDDEKGMMISQVIEQFFLKNDRLLHFIIFSYYVNKRTVNFIAVKLRDNCGAISMQPCAGKSNIRVPSQQTMRRKVEKELILAKAIIHELLVTCLVLLRTGGEKAKSIKIGY
ncbi:antiterminator Q family protein [Actinobacillus equuli subsp. haemolyticus]|uniref:antiterminator Q family protein n=1 Tax=Actinobacillus equuli TaxID=718 RepID=UPI0024429165|nr:antiterminator Q family protein [Actinobacillus equuli]WGE81817.1 antiterminator Q family protein [Actinobacillus equuli subsp. haemolyticus]